MIPLVSDPLTYPGPQTIVQRVDQRIEMRTEIGLVQSYNCQWEQATTLLI